MTRSTRPVDERGVAGVEGVVVGVVVVIALLLLCSGAWAVVDAKSAVTVAAREAGRAYVEAPSAGSASVDARAAATAAMTGHGRAADRTSVDLRGAGFGRCRRVVAVVRHRVQLVRNPWTGGGGGTVTVTARHSEVVDPYRSGIAGEARC